METLPALAIQQISSYLSVADLLACSLVSSGWRSFFNTDYVWRNVCLKTNSKITLNYVQTVHSTVSPTFEEPESTWSLEALCYWRIVYLKLMHVNRNWRRSNHETCKVIDFAYDVIDIQIDNDTIVANTNEGRCEVWNIKSLPKKQESLVLALKDTCCKCIIYLIKDMLVIVQDTLLQVYKKSSTGFLLKYRRLFDLPQYSSADIPLTLTIDDWYKGKVNIVSLKAYVIGRYFIGLVQKTSSTVFSFHVWDIVTGSKLKEEVVNNLSQEESVCKIKFCFPRTYLDKVLVRVQYFRRPQASEEGADSNTGCFTVTYLYDLAVLQLRKLSFLPPSVRWVFYEDHLFLTLDRTTTELNIFKSSSGEKVTSVCYKEGIYPDSVQLRGDYIGLTTDEELIILSMKQNFDVVFKIRNLKFWIDFDYVLMSWDLVLITWNKQNEIEVWNIKEQKQLSTLKANGLIFFNYTTKFFVLSEIDPTMYILKFW